MWMNDDTEGSFQVWTTDSGKHVMKKEITGFNHWVRALYVTDKELYCGSYQTIEVIPEPYINP